MRIAGVHGAARRQLRVAAGRDRVALIGRNGAGKTTTLRALMGLLPPAAGRASVRRRWTLDGVPPHHRARLGIGYAPEDRRLFASF